MSKQIQFTVSFEAENYLEWLARNVLLESTPDKAARYVFLRGLETIRRSDGVYPPQDISDETP